MVRRAEVGDALTIARHRAAMFADMGVLHASVSDTLAQETLAYLEEAIPSGEYAGWLAADRRQPESVLGGAGVQVRRVLPFPIRETPMPRVGTGRQGTGLNVYTEPTSRNAGIARLLMGHVIGWAPEAGLESLVLHASSAGRALYEELGFVPTNEMRFARSLDSWTL